MSTANPSEPTPVQPESAPVQPPTKRVVSVWAILIVFLAGIALGAIAFASVWMLVVQPKPKLDNVPPVAKVQDILTERVTTTKEVKEDYVTTTRVNLAEDPTEATLTVAWLGKPVFRSYKEVFGTVLETNRIEMGSADLAELDASAERGNQEANGNWELGTVTSGPFKGSTLYYQRRNACDPGGCGSFMFLLSPDRTQARLLQEIYDAAGLGESEESIAAREKLNTMFISAKGLKVATLSNALKAQDGSTFQTDDDLYSGYSHELYGEWLRDGKFDSAVAIGKTSDSRTIWQRKDWYDTYVQDDAGLPLRVASVAPSVEADFDKAIPKHAIVTWDSKVLAGKRTAKYYGYSTGGCDGFWPSALLPEEAITTSDLVQAGTSGGKPVYIPKDAANNASVKLAYEGWYVADGEKPSLEGFLKLKPVPVFFWEDALGRWVKYVDTDVQPMAECGKPVIYLYPTKTTAVSVKLPSFIDVTVSEPAYPAQGWKTVAEPNGRLTMADGKTYGSLYWEGNGVGYGTQKQGFMVKDGEQKTFLSGILPKYGLNAVEAKEFMDFWLPEMTGSPYYRVSFLTDEWNKAAPLYVSPKPDTNIRIFMDWQKLSSPMSIDVPRIITPERNGFTLVEWGGLLYR